MKTIPNFSDRCYAEATRDVIFLFQRKVWTLNYIPNFDSDDWDDPREYGIDGEGSVVLGEKDETGLWTPLFNTEGFYEKELSWEELSKMGNCESIPAATYHWSTERVFLSREEGNGWGTSKSYNYVDGWRVYSVCAEGKLAELLKDT